MKKYAWLLVLIASILWGANGIFVYLLQDGGLDSFSMTSIRLICATLLDFLFIFLSDRKLLHIEREDIPYFLICGSIGIFLFIAFYSLSISYTGMATAAVLIYLMPALVLIYSCLFLKEKLTVVMIISVFLSFIGCALASGIAQGFNLEIKGIIYGILAAFCYALNNIMFSTRLKKYQTMTRIAYATLASAICSLIYLAFFADLPKVIQVFSFKPLYLFIIILWAFTCSVVTYFLFNYSLNFLSITEASLISTFEPVAAAMFGIFLFGENPDIYTMIGMVLVLTSIILSEVFRNQN